MKRRARRTVILTAVLGAALVAVLIVTHWSMVRDHVEGWRFQLTTQTETLHPLDMTPMPSNAGRLIFGPGSRFQVLATCSQRVVTIDPTTIKDNLSWRVRVDGDATPTCEWMLTALREEGYRIIEQGFPRKAYVVTAYTSRPRAPAIEAPQWFMGASRTIDVKAAPGTPRSPFSE